MTAWVLTVLLEMAGCDSALVVSTSRKGEDGEESGPRIRLLDGGPPPSAPPSAPPSGGSDDPEAPPEASPPSGPGGGSAPDPRGDDLGAGGPCGSLDYLGECVGTIARWCDDGVVKIRECGAQGCGWVDDQIGYYCGGRGDRPGPGGSRPPPSPPPSSPPAGGGADPTDPLAGCGGATETEELRLTNEARASAGLPALVCDDALTRAARLHSKDMCDRDYFSHTSLDGRSFTDRIEEQGARYGAAGENIAWGQRTPAEVHAAWMSSPGHRSNILGRAYRRIGIGYWPCGGSPYWTQNFTD
ncbi:MAG: CAP domain-containing protein [Myxococcota bacterium]|nr:CAP domain-containing protein [Myxococcota bacterium]MDW8361861.1 CAP domain-containing protein [Myxococcales bacterium]